MRKLEKGFYLTALMAFVLTVSVGFSYAYFNAVTNVKNENPMVITARGDITLQFEDTNVDFSGANIAPGWNATKTFTITNNNNGALNYRVLISNVTNNLIYQDDLVFTLSSTHGGEVVAQRSVPNDDLVLINNVSIGANTSHDYTLKISYLNATDHNQIDDLGNTFNFTIEIK